MAQEDQLTRPFLLCLFPSAPTAGIGGIQRSGRAAWEALADSERWRARAVFLRPSREGGITWLTRLHAFLSVLGRRPMVTLVWHVALLRLIPWLGRTRVALFLHGVEAWDVSRDADWEKVDLFISNSDYTWRRFIELHPELSTKPHAVVHLGLGAPTTVDSPPDVVPHAIAVSRLQRSENYKGHAELIRMWPRLIENLPNAHLWIVGDGDLRAEIEADVEKLGLANHIELTGQIPDHEKEALISRSRCLALPSKGEGFGLVYIEAMRLGRPCLVSDMDAGVEVVNPPRAGLAVDPSDLEETAAAMTTLMTDSSEWDLMSEAARARYENLFTEGHFRERLLSALDEVLD